LEAIGVRQDWRNDTDIRVSKHVLALGDAGVINLDVVVEKEVVVGAWLNTVRVLKTAGET
jgi:hypothetical protein